MRFSLSAPLAGLILTLIANVSPAETVYRSAPGPELTNALAELSALSVSGHAGDPRFRALLQATATNFPLVDFDYQPGVAAPRKLVFDGPSDLNGFRFRLPDGGPWDFYWALNHRGSFWLCHWYVAAMTGALPRGFTRSTEYGSWAEQLPGYRNLFQNLVRLDGGREYVIWLQFEGAPPHELTISGKAVMTDRMPGPDCFAIHGYKPVPRPPLDPTPEEIVAADCERGDLQAVRSAVRDRKIELGRVMSREQGYGPLAIALAAGRLSLVADLIALGADPNGLVARNRTALMFAAAQDDPNAIALLVQKGARVEGGVRNGSTALMTAAEKGSDRALRKLLELGADPTQTNRMGKSALDAALAAHESTTFELIRQAIEKRASP